MPTGRVHCMSSSLSSHSLLSSVSSVALKYYDQNSCMCFWWSNNFHLLSILLKFYAAPLTWLCQVRNLYLTIFLQIFTGQDIRHLHITLPLTFTLARTKCLHSMRMGSWLSGMSSTVTSSRLSTLHLKMWGSTRPSIVRWLTTMDLLYFTRLTKKFHFLSLHLLQYPHFCMWPDKIHDGFRDGLYKSPLGYLASRLMGNASVWVQNTFIMGSSSEDYTIPQ